MESFAAFALVRVCYEVGTHLVEICNTWASANEEVRSRTIIVQSSWVRSRRQVDFMQRIAPTLDQELCDILDDLLNELYLCLSAASSQIDAVNKKETNRKTGAVMFRVRKTKYLWKKDALDAIIRDLEGWQRRFDPSWFLIMKIANPVIDSELAKARESAGSDESTGRGPPNAARSPLAAATGLRAVLAQSEGTPQPSVFLPDLPESVLQRSPIRHSDAKLVCFESSGEKKWYVMDTIFCHPNADSKALTRDVRSLATKFSQADPIAFGLLNCKGVMRVIDASAAGSNRPQVTAFNIIFRIPEGMQSLFSLRDLLLMPGYPISLTQKVRIACELTKSIGYVATFDFVHKNVRPESILCFNDPQQQRSHTFLVGFDAFRAADGSTILNGDQLWERNLYRHPLRQGRYPSEKYRMQHDIYSLGVCLLEIGLWESFVAYDENNYAIVGEWWPQFQRWLGAIQVPSQDVPWKIREYFVELARCALPARLGDKYARVVMGCLTCLDEDSQFAKGASDRGSMTIAVHFIEQIVSLMGEIAV